MGDAYICSVPSEARNVRSPQGGGTKGCEPPVRGTGELNLGSLRSSKGSYLLTHLPCSLWTTSYRTVVMDRRCLIKPTDSVTMAIMEAVGGWLGSKWSPHQGPPKSHSPLWAQGQRLPLNRIRTQPCCYPSLKFQSRQLGKINFRCLNHLASDILL